MGEYGRPTKLQEALAILGRNASRPPVILAGATDYFPARVGLLPDDDILDITAIPDLRGVAEQENSWRIGAATTWSDIADAPLPPLFTALQQAAVQVGGMQVQNAGTIAGNICNASPAADGVPVLMAMRARVALASVAGVREVPLADFITGNRRTLRRPDEIVTHFTVPKAKAAALSVFLKLGARSSLVISIAMVAVVLDVADGVVQAAGISVGACSAVAQRLVALETELIGRRLNAGIARRVRPEHFAALTPIDDIRADAAYRREAALVLARRALAQLGKG